jgi:hypothetical protein
MKNATTNHTHGGHFNAYLLVPAYFALAASIVCLSAVHITHPGKPLSEHLIFQHIMLVMLVNSTGCAIFLEALARRMSHLPQSALVDGMNVKTVTWVAYLGIAFPLYFFIKVTQTTPLVLEGLVVFVAAVPALMLEFKRFEEATKSTLRR